MALAAAPLRVRPEVVEPMPYRCTRCGSDRDTEPLEDGRAWCETCRLVFTPKQPPRLVEPPDTDEDRRKDLQ